MAQLNHKNVFRKGSDKKQNLKLSYSIVLCSQRGQGLIIRKTDGVNVCVCF